MVPLNIPELVLREIFLIRVRLPGGAAIIFAQSWNFELMSSSSINLEIREIREILENLNFIDAL